MVLSSESRIKPLGRPASIVSAVCLSNMEEAPFMLKEQKSGKHRWIKHVSVCWVSGLSIHLDATALCYRLANLCTIHDTLDGLWSVCCYSIFSYLAPGSLA